MLDLVDVAGVQCACAAFTESI